MERNPTAKEAIWGELQPLMEKQLSEGPLSEEELRQMERLSTALNALGTPHLDARPQALLNAFQQLALLRIIQEDSRKELRRLALLLERSTRRQKPAKVGIGFAFRIFALWIGLSILMLLAIRFLDDSTVQMLCAGSMSALLLAIFVCEKQLAWDDSEQMGNGGKEDDDWRCE